MLRVLDGLRWVGLSFVVPTMSQGSVCSSKVFHWGRLDFISSGVGELNRTQAERHAWNVTRAQSQTVSCANHAQQARPIQSQEQHVVIGELVPGRALLPTQPIEPFQLEPSA